MMIDELQAMLPRVSCAAIVDAVAKRYPHPAHVLDLVSPTPGRVLFGPAATIRFFPTRRDVQHPVENDFASCFYRAIGGSGKGKVLVMSNGGYPEAALGGSRKLFRLNHAGLAGVLAGGRLRDFSELAGYEFVTYCRGETVRQGAPWVMPLAANVPIEVYGVGVFPGDWIYASAAGVVVIPAPDVQAVLQDAMAGEERDAASKARMASEDPAQIIAKGEPR
ncbi:MAG: RraA family protein [Burkholderiales bacterium]